MLGLSLFDTLLPLWILVSMVVGVVIGYYAPNVSFVLSTTTFGGVSLPTALGLLAMMYPVFCNIQYREILTMFKNPMIKRQILFSLVVNWLFAPLYMVALAWATLPDLPAYRSGIILVGTARCIAMVMIWNRLAGGNEEFCATVVAINSVLQICLYGPLSYFYVVVVGQGPSFDINMWIIVRSVLVFMGIPLLAGFLTQCVFSRYKWYDRYFLPVMDRLALIALVYIIIILFALQGHEIIRDIRNVVRTAVPLVIYFATIFFVIFFICYRMHAPYDIIVPQSFTAASNNFELAIAVAIGSFGVQSTEALATTIGSLIEVPVLVTLVYVTRYIKKRLGI